MKLDKSKPKKANYNEDALKILKDKYGFSMDYIRKSIRGDRVGLIPDKLKTEYKTLETAAKNAVIAAADKN